MKRILILTVLIAAFFFESRSAAAQSYYDFQPVMVPIITGDKVFPGAFGSQWHTTAWVYNESDSKVTILQGLFSRPVFFSEPVVEIPPHSTVPLLFVANTEGEYAALYYVHPAELGHLSFQVRLHENAFHAQHPVGVEIPVVRPPEFRSVKVDLLAVPISDGTRQTVRVYMPAHGYTETRCTVRVYDQETGALRYSTVLSPYGNAENGHPAVGVIANLREAMHVTGDAVVRIEATIELPEGPPSALGGGIWAMASITDDETQTVTIISPQ
jgi:hypothetical protein